MFIYFAHPIDLANGHPLQDQLKKTIHLTEDAADAEGHSLFRPGRAYRLGYDSMGLPDPADQLVLNSINQYALAASNALVAILVDGIPTLGVPAEIEQALDMNKPTLILTSANLSVNSIQVQQWASRGAQVRIIVPGKLEEIRLTDWLGWLPRPDEFPREQLDVSTFDGPATITGKLIDSVDLQVRYDTAAKPMTRAHDTDAGLDLATLETAQLVHGVRTMLRTGIQAPPPVGWWGLIKSRSSTIPNHGVMVHEAVIDAGYQGELMIAATLVDTGRSSLALPAGTRLAQYILIPTFPGCLRVVDEFGPSQRGIKGYGSSGA